MTVTVIRHAAHSSETPNLPAQLGSHAVVCRECNCVEEISQCLCQIKAQPDDWVVLELGDVDEQQWREQGSALGAALETLPTQYIEVRGTAGFDLESRLRLHHAPTVVVVDHRSGQGGYPLSLGIIRNRLVLEA